MADADDDLEDLLQRATAITDRESEERWDIVRHLHGKTDRRTFEAASVLAHQAIWRSGSLASTSWPKSVIGPASFC